MSCWPGSSADTTLNLPGPVVTTMSDASSTSGSRDAASADETPSATSPLMTTTDSTCSQLHRPAGVARTIPSLTQ